MNAYGKCPDCGGAMKPLASSTFCPKDCDRVKSASPSNPCNIQTATGIDLDKLTSVVRDVGETDEELRARLQRLLDSSLRPITFRQMAPTKPWVPMNNWWGSDSAYSLFARTGGFIMFWPRSIIFTDCI